MEEILLGRVAVLDVGLLRHPWLVDDDWAIEVLEWWVANAPVALAPGQTFGPESRRMDALREREAQTVEVVRRAGGRVPPFGLMNRQNRFTELRSGLDAVAYALGKLKTAADTRAHLGTPAPVMAADAMHAEIWDAAKGLWSDGHHGPAVQRAATFLNAYVQDRSGRHDLSDAKLMAQVFSADPAAPGKPRLRWQGDVSDETITSMRSGILNFSQGCFMAIRNPVSHGTEDLPRQVALEQLATLSTLARWVDECVVEIAE